VLFNGVYPERVGTVDKFQVRRRRSSAYLMCSSTLEGAPRGAQFLLEKNRLNVEISRAQALAVVVGSEPSAMYA
jgi:uncharacterized protein